jgi:hypothetical protein
MSPARFEPTTLAGKLTQTHTSYRAANGIDFKETPAGIFCEEEGVELVLDRKVCERRKKNEIKYHCSSLGQLNWSFVVGDGCHSK